MGKHFDALVELVKESYITENDKFKAVRKGIEDYNVKQYLDRLVKKAALFDFPLNAEEIFPRSGKDFSEYVKYVQDFFDISHQYGDALLMPFPNTAIEDKVSVVLFDYLGDNEYRVVTCNMGSPPMGIGKKLVVLAIGDMGLEKPDHEFKFGIKANILFDASLIDGVRMDHIYKTSPLYFKTVSQDLATAAVSYAEQLIYIMDPENFIICKESNASIGQIRNDNRKKKRNISYKTVMRPHYVCLNTDEIKEFLQSESKVPRAAHPVRGHWRRLMSEKFKNKQGQTTFIKQYWTGDGKVKGKGGWNYQVFIKESPTAIKPYN